jgi:hypothetical protein
MLKPVDVVRALVYPLRDVSILLSSLLIFLLLEFALSGGILGLFLLFLVLPSLFRYLMRILESRSKGQDPGPLVAEDLLWIHSAWSLFVIVHAAVLVYATYLLGSLYGLAAMLAINVLLAVVIPASLAVLAITRSPIECLNPRSVTGLISRTGSSYWILPTYFLLAAFLVWTLNARPLPDFVVELIGYYLIFAFFSLTGAVVQPYRFHKEVGIHEPVEPDQEAVDEDLQRERTNVLNHAYGFISRGNRAGGFKHIRGWLQQDPEPDNAWQWFFEQMMCWEIKEPALVFAQTYLSRLLQDNEYVAAVKLMMRCRLENEAFLPSPDDRELAREAAEYCQNEELMDIL